MSNDPYRDLIEAMPQVAWTAQPDGQPECFNQRWVDYTGADRKNSDGSGWQSFFHPDDLARYPGRWTELLKSEEPFEIEFRLKRAADGNYRWHACRAVPLRGPDGRTVKWLAICTDIHEQKLAAEELHESQERSRLLLEGVKELVKNTPIGLMVLRGEPNERVGTFKILSVNPAVLEAMRLKEFTIKELAGKSIAEIFPAISDTELGATLQAVMHSGQPRHLSECHYADFHAPEGIFAIEAFPLPNCCIGIALENITERKRAEGVLKQTAAELGRTNAELEQFAYAASHDLQEPLRTVVSATQLLAREYSEKLDSEAKEWLAFAAEGAKRMQVLLNALLDYARLGAVRKPFERVDCWTAYQTAVANLRAAIEETGAELIAGRLPIVMGDGLQLIQLFQNLVANAIKFRGKDRPHIHVSAEQHDKDWRIDIRDNGIGIDPRHFGRLFVLFQRLHTREQYRGTGIGLAICKKIVERHGGRIGVESAPGAGSTFYFTIPMVRAESLQATPLADSTAGAENT